MFLQYGLRVAQLNLGIVGLGLLLSYFFDTLYIESAFASKIYILVLLIMFGFSIFYSIFHVLLVVGKLKPGILGMKHDTIVFWVDIVVVLFWGFAAISLLMKVMKADCLLLNGYIGLCTVIFPLDILAWVLLVMGGTTAILMWKDKRANGG